MSEIPLPVSPDTIEYEGDYYPLPAEEHSIPKHSPHETSTSTNGIDPFRVAEVMRQGTGEEMALLKSEIYSTYGERITAFCQKRIRTDDVEDTAQEIFITAFSALDRGKFTPYPGKDGFIPFGVWLFKIARTTIASLYRKQPLPTQKPLSLDFYREQYGEPSIRSSFTGELQLPGEEIIQQDHAVDEHILLTNAVHDLSPSQRDVIQERFLNASSVGEAARKLGKTESNVKATQHYAIRNLRRKLGGS